MSGSGKTTVARSLLEHGEIAFDSKINKGIFHFVDKDGNVADTQLLRDEAWRKRYKWSLNMPMLKELLQANADAERVFLCGRGNIRQYWDLADKVFLLKVSPQTLLARLNDEKRDNLFAKDSEAQQRVLKDLDFVYTNMIAAGAITIDAEQPIEKVVNDIILITTRLPH